MTTAGPAVRGQSLWRRFRWSLFNSMGGLAVSIVTFLAISRVVEPSEYGRCSVIMAIWGLLGNAVDWCGVLMMRFGPVELHERGTLRTTLSTRLVFAAPAVAALTVFAPVYLSLSRGWTPALLGLTVAWLLVWTAYDVLQWCGVASQRFGMLTLSSMLFKGAPLCLVLMSRMWGFTVRAEMLVATTLVGVSLSCLLLATTLRGLIGIARPDRTLLGSMWWYSLPALIGMPARAVLSWLDPLLLNHWASQADLGRYQLAYPTFTVFAALGASFNSVFSPELVRKNALKDDRTVERYRRHEQPQLATLLGLGGFGGACIAAPLVHAILPQSYALTADLVALFSVAGGFLLAFWTLHPLVTATDSVWSLQAAQVLQAIAHVIFVVLLAPVHGALGAAGASVCDWTVAFITLSLLLRRRIGASAAAIVPVTAVGAFTAALLCFHVPLVVRVPIGLALIAFAGTFAWRAACGRKGQRQVTPYPAPRCAPAALQGPPCHEAD